MKNLQISIRRGLTGAALGVSLAGCPSDDDGQEPSDTDGNQSESGPSGDDDGSTPRPMFPTDPNNPDFRRLLTGIDPNPRLDYTRFDIGAIGSETCCDYVLASPASDEARVVLGLNGPGLSMAQEGPDELIDFGGGLADVKFADVNEDGALDIVALRLDGGFGVSLAFRMSGERPFFDPNIRFFGVESAEGSRLAVADTDCDGSLDVIRTEPSFGVISIFRGSGDGTFLFQDSIQAGERPNEIAAGDLTGDGNADLVLGNSDSAVTVVLNRCSGSYDVEVIDLFSLNVSDAVVEDVVLGRFCPGHPDDTAIAAVTYDGLDILCGDGSGDFLAVRETETSAAADYRCDTSPDGAPFRLTASSASVLRGADPVDILYYLEGSSLYRCRLRNGVARTAARLVQNLSGGEAPQTLSVVAGLQPNTWRFVAFLGPVGLGVLR